MATETETATAAAVPTAKATTKLTARPVMPDQTAFEQGIEKLEKELKVKSEKQEYFNSQLKLLSTDSGHSEKGQELRDQLKAVQKRQGEIRDANKKVFEEIKTLDEDIKRKIKDIVNAKSKLRFKSVDELDSHIKKLEAQVNTGTLKLVEEKRLLSDISALKRSRNGFNSIRELDASIAESKAKVSELRSKVEDKESKELSSKHQAISDELNAIRSETDKVYKNRSALIEQRNEARKAREEAYSNLRKFKNDFYQQRRDFNKYEQAEKQKLWERQRAEREAQERERRMRRAAVKLEAASQPAYAADISQAESLLTFFAGTEKPVESVTTTSLYTGPASRLVELPANTEIISNKFKDDEVLFVGKKGKKKGGDKSAKNKSKEEKFTLDINVVSTLSRFNIGVPMSREEVPTTVDALKAKIQYFLDNQDKVTQDNIKKAQDEIDKIEKEAEIASAAREKKSGKKTNGNGAEPLATPDTTEVAESPATGAAVAED
ncbi:uncharacterized protein V1516DRAFT_647242 [Lipomyces oligophaga]|uniref:uncharacterized protein n=1 Tax=Lipomyces oligophaga TaxID=45792 RepID=UPI0034CF352D